VIAQTLKTYTDAASSIRLSACASVAIRTRA
jgi:hypothetical protein